jgi:hypothetical protein
MTKPERRQTPRKLMETLAYVNLAPDNGGLVLNVSEGGFGFQAVMPMQQAGSIRFWCSLPGNHRVEAVGELAWTDATRKTGGLRLTSAPAKVREQILSLTGRPALPMSTDEDPAAQVPAVLAATAVITSQSEKDVAPASDSVVRQNAPLLETRVPAPFRSPPRPLAPARRVKTAISTVSRAQARPRSFRRAVIGLLILVVAGAALLLNVYRRPVGVSLIQLGGKLAGTPLPQTVLPVPVGDSASNSIPESVDFAANSASSLESENQLQPQIDETDHQSESDAEEPLAPARTRLQKSATRLSARVPNPSHASTDATPPAASISSMPESTTSALPTSTTSDPNPASAAPVASSRFESTGPSERSPGSASELDVGSVSLTYFEVGNFKDPLWADKATETLVQSGFHSIVVRKGRLWMNSYHVLVGPFDNDAAAGTAQRNLESQGFKPRSTRISPNKSQ